MRTLGFDKLCLGQSLDAEPRGAAPWKGSSSGGNAARINPSFSAIQTKDAPLGRFFVWGFDYGMRTLGFDKLCLGQSLDAEP